MVIALMFGLVAMAPLGCTDEPQSDGSGGATVSPLATATGVPTNIPTPTPTATPSATPTDTPTPTATPAPTVTPSPTPVPAPTPVEEPSGASDLAALVALYEATNGAEWEHNGNWLSDKPVGEWDGVTANRSGRVIELVLSDNRLRGEIPAELGSLTDLQILGLPKNQLSGEIPPELGNLPSLTVLDLAFNQLTGGVPAELGRLANLQRLYLHENRLSGRIPPELGSLTDLQTLWLDGNELSGGIPPEMGSLASLQALHLHSNRLSGEIPSELGNLSNLRRLWLSVNQLSGQIPSELGRLSSLEELSLHSNRLSGRMPPELGSLSTLVKLFLARNSLTGCLPDGWRDVSESDLNALGLPFCGTTSTARLSPAEVYERVSPSVAFIETPAATGSGVLIGGGYVITNYHVVWPYDSVRVVFPDGTELEGVAVAGWDPMADLAALGPVDVPAQPAVLKDAERDTDIGAELFLIGYPAETEQVPQPSITRGVLSRFREWEQLGMTYFQTDAAIAGGQSGGALVNSKGHVVGISTFSFSDAGFGWAASWADLMPIVERLIQGEFASELGDRRLPTGSGAFEFSIELANYWDTRAFLLDATAGTALEVEMEGPGDGGFRVSDPFEAILEEDDGYTGVESGTVEPLTSRIHVLQAGMLSGDSSGFELSSSVRLRPLNDPDDGQPVTVGETVAGSLDHPSDRDWYSIRLKEGETVRISTDSVNVDTAIFVDFPGSRVNQIVSDDNGGGGLFGTNSELVYRAPHSGEYVIAVSDAGRGAFGGYYLSVEPAREGTQTVVVPPGPQLVDSRFGTMMVLESPSGDYSVQVPEAWVEVEFDGVQGEVFSAQGPMTNIGVVIVEEDVLALGSGQLSLDGYADLIESVFTVEGFEDIARETVETEQGLSAIKLEGSILGQRVIRFVHLSDSGLAINISYAIPPDQLNLGERLSEHSFNSFRVN